MRKNNCFIRGILKSDNINCGRIRQTCETKRARSYNRRRIFAHEKEFNGRNERPLNKKVYIFMVRREILQLACPHSSLKSKKCNGIRCQFISLFISLREKNAIMS